MVCVQIDDLEERSKSAAADKFRRTEAAEAAKVLQETKAEELVVSEQPESEEELDEIGVEPNDIELVMSQAGVSRNKAVKALRDNKNDIVNAIMVRSFLNILLSYMLGSVAIEQQFLCALQFLCGYQTLGRYLDA